MATLASFTAQTDGETGDINIPADGPVQVLVRGSLGAKGRVYAVLKGDDAVFHPYPEMSFFTHNGAREINLLSGDVLRLRFENCTSADVEVRQ